ncbi:putative HECT-type E3 ubiquitin transferase [Microsporum canis]
MDSMINIPSPFSWFSSIGKTNDRSPSIDIEPIQTHDIEAAEEKPGRRLRQLLKLNHVTNSILYNNLSFYNHIPHLLSTAYLFGGSPDHLDRLYDLESKELEPWSDSPGEIGQVEDWRSALGKRESQRAYLDFFEDELTQLGYDWNAVVTKYLFSDDKPLINSLISGFGHPLIHLGYAFEMSSREIAMESLAMISCCYDDVHKFFDDQSDIQINMTPRYTTNSPFEVIQKIHGDRRFDGMFATPGGDNVEVLFKTQQTLILEHWMAWDPKETGLTEQLRTIQRLAATLMATRHAGKQHDFFFDHLLTTTHALRVIIPMMPTKFHESLLRQWFLLALTVYIAQLRPKIEINDIGCYNREGKDWDWVDKQALTNEMAVSPHYIKPLRTLKEAAKTWGDDDEFFLRAAVKFVDTFDGFGGFG